LSLPADYEQQERWPLVLFLHGAGERGEDINLVKVHGPPKRVDQGDKFPFILVSPQCPKNHDWEPLVLTALLDDIESRYKVDQDRIYVTGLSMGGFGTWALAAYTPDRFAALIPICAGGGEPYWIKRFSHVPIWMFHGSKDNETVLSLAEEMSKAAADAKANFKMTVYPEVGHNSWTETYNNPAVYEWMLQQKRQPVRTP